MKKFLFTIIAFAGLLSTSCVQEHIEAVYDPSKVTGQALESFSGCVLAEDGADVTTSFSPVDFGLQVAVKYALYASTDQSFVAPSSSVSATIAVTSGKGSITIKQKTLNSLVYALGGEANVPFTLYFKLCSYVANDKSNSIEKTLCESNVVCAEFTPYATDVKDVDLYNHVWVIGASDAVGAWSFDKVHQYLYDYDKTGTTYTGVIDYGEAGPSGGFKLTGVGNWDDPTRNWGSEAQAEEAEAPTVQIIAGNGSKDIKCYSKRFYAFSFNTSSLVLTRVYGFNNIGLVGSINGWDAADANLKMSYNDYYHRFYIDYTFAEDAEVKFTCDDSWDLNFGAGCVTGGDNIKVTSGSYRIYLDLNKKTIDFSTSMFGKDEPGGEEPGPGPEPTYEGWGITGSIEAAGINWDGDVAMTESEGVWTGYVTLKTTDQFKFRKDAAWDENFGASGDVEPFVITDGTAFQAVAGGKNMAVPADNFYKLVLDVNNSSICVSATTVWGVIGDFNSWAGDVFMTETDGKWVSPAITLEAGKGFKVRKNAGWDDNRGAEGDAAYVVTPGVPFPAVPGGQNLTVADAGEYIVTYDASAETITVDAALPQNCWSLIGSIAGSSWNKDFYMTEADGLWISDPIEIKVGNEFKVRFNNDWAVNKGAAKSGPAVLSYGMSLAAEQDGSNLSVAEDGTYRVVYDSVNELLFLQGWSVIGQVNGSGWDKDIVMTPYVDADDGKTYWSSPVFSAEGEFKIRFGADWAVNRGAEGDKAFVIKSGEPFKAVQNGQNLAVNAEEGKYYMIVYNATDDELAVLNSSWSVIGQVNGSNWDKDIVMIEAAGMFISQTFTCEGQFKIRFNHDWSVNRGATGDVEPVTISAGSEVEVVNNGKNLAIEGASGQYSIVYNPKTEKITLFRASE